MERKLKIKLKVRVLKMDFKWGGDFVYVYWWFFVIFLVEDNFRRDDEGIYVI